MVGEHNGGGLMNIFEYTGDAGQFINWRRSLWPSLALRKMIRAVGGLRVPDCRF